MGFRVGVEEDSPLRQECIFRSKRVLYRPLHSVPEFSLSARDVDSVMAARYVAEYGNNLNWAVRDRKAQLDSAPGKRLSRQNAHRPDYRWEKKCFCTAPFEKKRTDSPSEIGTDLYPNLLVLNCDHTVLPDAGPSAGLAEALVWINSIGIVRRGDRPCWNQRMGQQKLDGLSGFEHLPDRALRFAKHIKA